MKTRKNIIPALFAAISVLAGFLIYSCTDNNVNPVENNSPDSEVTYSYGENGLVYIDSFDADQPEMVEAPGLGKSAATNQYKSSLNLNRTYHNIPSTSTAKAFTWNYTINEQPLDINGNALSNTAIESGIQMALSIWSSACGASFSRITSGTPSLRVTFSHSYGSSVCSAGGSSSGGNVTLYCYTTCNNTNTRIPYGSNQITYIVNHEAGHALGLKDMRRNGCYNNYDVNQEYAKWDGSAPAPSCMYDGVHYATNAGVDKSTRGDPNYYSWRIAFAGTTYNVFKDSHVSCMDYDFQAKWWGWPSPKTNPDNPQPGYPSLYDVELLKEKYGDPDYRPLLIMFLTKDRAGNDYGGTTVGNGYATNDWDDVNRLTREFGTPNDLSGIAGLMARDAGTGLKALYRYRGSNYTYKISTATSISGWTREKFLGYVKSSSSTMKMQIGTSSKDRAVIPLYQYYNTTYKKYNITTKDHGNPSGWTKETIGYIVPSSALANP